MLKDMSPQRMGEGNIDRWDPNTQQYYVNKAVHHQGYSENLLDSALSSRSRDVDPILDAKI